MKRFISTLCRSNVCGALVGAILGLLLFFPFHSVYTEWVTPKPYSNVQVVSATEIEEGRIRFAATFEKKHCKFVRLEAFGTTLDVPVRLGWSPVDEPITNYDRSTGEQLMVLDIFNNNTEYDEYEIRVRHRCINSFSGEKLDVDTSLAVFTVPTTTERSAEIDALFHNGIRGE